MRTDSAIFSAANSQRFKEPRFYVEVSFDDANTDLRWFTSHDDVDLPTTATAANTFHGTLKYTQTNSQRLDFIKALSSIGNGVTTITDNNGTVSELLRDKWIIEEALRSKRFRTYFGFKGFENSDYSILGTQYKYVHDFDGLDYKFKTEDSQRNIKTDIFVLNDTTLSQSILVDQLAIPLNSVTDFEMSWHDVNHTDSPNETVGYISIKKTQKEIIKYKAKLDVAVLTNGTDIFFTASDNSVNSTSTDLSIFTSGQFINLDGTGSNDSNVLINTVTSTKVTTFALDGGVGAIIDEAAGNTFSINAPIQVYNCTRGSLNTLAQPYEVDTALTVDRRQLVNEHVYIETTLPKIIYSLITGVIIGTIYSIPPGWHQNISTSLVDLVSFTDKLDLYNPADESGMIHRFSGETETDGKIFIAEQCAMPMASFTRIKNDGSIALQRNVKTLSDSSYVRHIKKDDIKSFTNLIYDDNDVHSLYSIKWNYEDEKEKTTRTEVVADAGSVAKQKSTNSINLTFRGLHGSIHTKQNVYDIINMLADSYSGPPIKFSTVVSGKHNDLEIGNIIRYTIDEIYDSTNRETVSLDRSMRIIGSDFDSITQGLTLHLFGSTESPTPLKPGDLGFPLSNDFYGTAGGRLAATKLDNVGLTTNNVGGTLHITANGTLTGEASITENSIYWWDGPLTFDATVTQFTWTKNIHIYAKGVITNNAVDDAFSSIGGGATTGPSEAGNTKSGGAIHFDYNSPKGSDFSRSTYSPEIFPQSNIGLYDSIPFTVVKASSSGDTLSGLPVRTTGSSSPNGKNTHYQDSGFIGSATGGAAASGGGGLTFVCRGIASGASSKFNSSGANGNLGGISKSDNANTQARLDIAAGSSGGGAPGFIHIFLDGNDSINGLSDSNFIQKFGDTSTPGSPLESLKKLSDFYKVVEPLHHFGVATGGQSVNQSFWRVQYIPGNEIPVIDEPDLATKITNMVFVESKNSPRTPSRNLSTVQVNVTTPTSTNYSYANIYVKLSTQSDDEYLRVPGSAKDSILLPHNVMDGKTYDIISKSVSNKGIESTDYYKGSFTVANESGGDVLGNGNYIALGQTAFDTGLGIWLEKIASGAKASFGDSAGNKVLINTDAADIIEIIGKLTASTGVIGGWTISATSLIGGSGSSTVGLSSSGTWRIWAGNATASLGKFRVNQAGAMVAEGGTIAGWDFTATRIANSTGRLYLDSSTSEIRARNVGGTNYVKIDDSGITGVDNTLGTTFRIYTDGTAPEFSSGVITSTIYNISTSGILRTSATVGDGSANSDGVIINDTGIKGFPSSSSTPNFFLSTADGSIISKLGTIAGWTISSSTLANGSNIVLDATNAAISINDATFGNSGIQAQYNSGSPRFYVGDGADSDITFDSAAGEFTLGRDVKLRGGSSHNGDVIYLNDYLYNAITTDALSGTGAVATTTGQQSKQSSVGASAGTVQITIQPKLNIIAPTWDKDRTFKLIMSTPSGLGSTLEVGLGELAVSNSRRISFKFETDGVLYAITANGTTTLTPVSLGAYTNNTEYNLYIDFSSGTSAKFYVNSVLKTTVSTQLPSGTTNADKIFNSRHVWVSGGIDKTFSYGQFITYQAYN